MAQTRNIKYINREFDDFRDQLVEFSKSYFPDTYNDFSPTSPGMMFMEMAAYVGDVLSFYTDTQLRESFLLLAQEDENLYNLAYSLGYKPKVTNTSTVMLDVFQLVPSDASNDYQPDMDYALNIKEGSSFASSGPKFITEKDANFKIDSDLSPLETTVYSINNSTNKPEYYLLNKKVKAHSGEIKLKKFEIGSYSKFLTLTLNDTDIIEIESIVDSNGDKWTEVPYLAQDTVFEAVENIASKDPELHGYNESTPYLLSLKKVPKRFVTRVKSNNTLEIQFGAGENSVVDEDVEFTDNAEIEDAELASVSNE